MSKKIMVLLGTLVLAGCAAHTQGERGQGAQMTQNCAPIDESGVAALFERWNQSLQTGKPDVVAKNYAERSILLPTLSGVNRVSTAEKVDYFEHFLAAKPQGKVTDRQITLGCNMAVDSGLYTFHMGSSGKDVGARYTYTYQWNGQDWLIVSHHSSLSPVDK
ncbi:DUF4440 domain-containing protein [Alcaligenes aquatilis]|uniref:DUF4440 domain-containing protein n=1 Tax=Alcaligenes aquatilis TaxID=323284 RepID=A0ABY4NKH5_9BURK|nr:DUF4440 domain-containing protein [Alcaligenes aquatilis]UQN37273.1 DUF4440 domain-containing protein [Alcaligenes aquatilis]